MKQRKRTALRELLPLACLWAVVANLAGCAGCTCTCGVPSIATSPASSASSSSTSAPTGTVATTGSTAATSAPTVVVPALPSLDAGALADLAPTMSEEAPQVTGALKVDDVRDTVHKNYVKLRNCHMEALKQLGEKADGASVVTLSIAPDGTVSGIQPGDGVTASRELENCVVDTFRGLTFPKSNGPSNVTYKLNFALPPEEVTIPEPPSFGHPDVPDAR